MNAAGEVLVRARPRRRRRSGTRGSRRSGSRRSRSAFCMPMPIRRTKPRPARCCARAFPGPVRDAEPRDPARIPRIRAHLDDRAQRLRRSARAAAISRRFEGFAREASFAGKIAIMRSNGGTMSIAQARREPVAMMESGPVAGMIGAGRLAGLLGIERAIGFDMGGTTAKCALITGGIAPIEEGYVIGDAVHRPADAVAGGRHRRGRRRRRLASPGATRRRPACRAGERGRRSGPRLLRPRRRGAGRDRRRSPARPPQRRALSRRRHDARSRAGAKRAIGRIGPTARPRHRRRGARHRHASRTAPCRWRCARCRSKGHRPARHRADRLRRRRPAARRRHRARDFDPARGHSQAARQFLRARHADGAMAAGFRPHAGRRARRASTRARPRAPSPSCAPPARRRSRATTSRDQSRARASTSPPTCAIAARSTRSPSPVAGADDLTGDTDATAR